MRDEDERCVHLFAELFCPTLIAGAQRKEEGATGGEFRLGEAERSFVYPGACEKRAVRRVEPRGEDGMARLAVETVASRIL